MVAGRRGRHADAGARRLAVHARLLDLMDPSGEVIAGDAVHSTDERRPAFGCPPWQVVGEWTIGSEEARTRVVAIPEALRTAGPQLLQWAMRKPGQLLDAPRVVSVAILAAHAAEIPVDLPAIGGGEAVPGSHLTLRIRRIVPERVRTSPVQVPPGGVLDFGVAIDPTMPHDDVEAVVFALAAETSAGEQPLFETRLVANDPAAWRWNDHRIALDALAGAEVRFVFTTRLVARAGADPARVAARPLWGAPEILAPSDDPRARRHPDLVRHVAGRSRRGLRQRPAHHAVSGSARRGRRRLRRRLLARIRPPPPRT
jgi:hypothetical protein